MKFLKRSANAINHRDRRATLNHLQAMSADFITNRHIPHQAINDAYEEARFWIGRRLILRKPLLDYAPGTPCVVMCVVDFGDGPLLWIVTDDKRAVEVDQLELSCVSDYFQQRQTETLGTTAQEIAMASPNSI